MVYIFFVQNICCVKNIYEHKFDLFKRNRSRTIQNILFQTAFLNAKNWTTHLQRLFQTSE